MLNNFFNSSTVYSLFTLGLFLITFAYTPNLKVDKVSDILSIEGEHAIINVVLVLPPRECYKILVNLESLYGICDLFSLRAFITNPKVVKDLFIILASSNLAPHAPVLDTFSEPAKSTKESLADLAE